MALQFRDHKILQTQAKVDLFTIVFSASEGAAEGELIGQLVADMLQQTAAKDLSGFVAVEGDVLAGGVLFSRFKLPVNKTAFILSPMAIATDQQGKGLGQALINHGLVALKAQGVEVLLTYGDPNYYQKVGFEVISQDFIEAPQPLSYPDGWLAQSLTDQPLLPMPGKTRCVDALNRPEFW
ncbi:N-acetyltransferase [Marinicella sp. S1101]|uniref:GNAT family N-acetyltransferase n=1 Tax=Marinicella marina TaxID=2996016 RepID=UPI002260D0DB|nr:N-acetyltransferase [Marinicella marina]MCX7554362.1 N-acetyltransferase [Marinicella marina]MDJ1138647.1 N-acetyltransferase [Marinicella marina]